jgi:muramidase (phage lysozyme)
MNIEGLRLALNESNVRAFLKAIRLGEGTADEPLGYYRLVGGGEFSDDARHPNILVNIPRYNVNSTAAGAYQIIHPTWKGLVKQYGFKDFTPETQDLAAVALIVEKKALNDVLTGRFAQAVEKCAPIWASLPGSTAGQRTEPFERVLQVYLEAGGNLA